MNEYLFHRSRRCPTPDTPPELLADDVFFHQWTTRQHPFNEIESGDRLWWADKESREIRWELRAVEVLKQQYSSPMEALSFLRRAYGLVPDQLNDYFASAPSDGWLLAFAVEVMQPVVGVTLPPGERLARNGLRTVTPELRTQLERVGLPTSAAQPLTRPAGAVNAQAITSIFVPNPTRHIPSWVKAEVWERSGGLCQECDKTVDRGEIHFDHFVPFSRGGPSTVENLRVLCAPCNLSKGAKMPPRASVRVFDEPVADLAAVLGRHQPRSIDDLVALLGEAARSGEIDATRAAALTLYRDPEFSDSDLDRCIDAIDQASGLEDLVEFLRVHDSAEKNDALTALLGSDDSAVRLQAGVELCAEGTLDDDTAMPILLEAASGSDRYLSDLAVIVGAPAAGIDPNPGFPKLESVLDSPVMVWRCSVALSVAESLFDDMVEGDKVDVDRFLDLCEVALASPSSETAHQAALLLAYFWGNGRDDRSLGLTDRYLEFASQSDDDDLLADVEDLRQSLATAQR